MSEVVLVPGSCHGAWCWHRVIPQLSALGHHVRAIDLPGDGQDGRDPAQVTLDDYAATIQDAIQNRAVLVGHSAGGFAIAAAAASQPARVQGLLYVCAYVPKPGQSVADMRRAGPSQPLAGSFHLAPDRSTYRFAPDRLKDLFYHDCPDADVRLARERLTAQPTRPQQEPFAAGAAADHLPRHYIRCTDDRAIPPDWQTAIAGTMPITDLPTGHSPFFAAPDALARIIDRFARETV